MRTLGSRRFRALVRACVAEIGGDVSGLSELDRLAISQTAALMLQIENMQAALVAGERVDPDVIIRTNSECRRSHGKSTLSASVDDEEWLGKLHRREVALYSGDSMRCRVAFTYV